MSGFIRPLPHLADRTTGIGIGQVRAAINKETRLLASRSVNSYHLEAAHIRTDVAIANYQNLTLKRQESLNRSDNS